MPQRLAQRVLLLGWDAADWKFARPMMERGEMPALTRLVSGGVSGNLATLRPILSPMLWNSIATGKRPFGHGIFGFTEPRPDGTGVRPVASTSRRCKALWNIASESGLRSHVVNWFASHPAEPVTGTVVSNRFADLAGKVGDDWPVPAHAVHPPARAGELAALRVHPGELDAGVVTPFMPTLKGHQLDPTNHRRLGHFLEAMAETLTTQALATHLLKEDDWDLGCVYFEGIDRFAHAFMEFHPPRMEHVGPRFFEMYSGVMTGVYRFFDMMLHALMQTVGEETTIVLCSDHGYQDGDLRPPGPAERSNPVSWHRPLGILAMSGPGVRPGRGVYGASLLDVAPTVLALLGLPPGLGFDGRPLLDTLPEGTPPVLPVDWEATAVEGSGMHPADHRGDPEQERQALRQLVELGYIADPGEDAAEAIRDTRIANTHREMTSYFDAERFDDAMRVAEAMAAEFPDEPRSWLSVAACHLKRGDADAAVRVLDGIATEEAEVAEQVEALRAQVAFAEGDEREMERRAAELPADPAQAAEVHRLRAQLALRRTDAGAAESAFRAVLAIDDADPAAHDGLAQVHLHRRDWEAAAEAALDAIGCAFFLPRAHLHLGMALANLGRDDEAIAALNVALHQHPGFARAHRLLECLHARNGRQDEAVRHRLALRGIGQPAPADRPDPTAPAEARSDDPDDLPPPDAGTVWVVSGLPRAGTSLAMQMLAAAGVPPLTDGRRQADESNRRGYFEHEAVTRLAEDAGVVADAAGRAIKVIHALVDRLPVGHAYRVLWMERDLDEVIASQRTMLRRQGRRAGDPTALRLAYEAGTRRAQNALARRADTRWIRVPHRALVERDPATLEAVAAFLGRPEAADAMTAAIDPSLYRERAAALAT
ncbi:alkaline phosphatase family protein [Phycisphaera mikurensis]|uniref:Uncharacterized protein n=1 Tax=Phycisphaera mikurensis (strain NBRC 102666 / KCTC 22515 / FYK2301M01) TaxID=1142394 RepID=I0ICU1_PHYMF|nr:alkaline phosphatase family protein [Phycisphaera mikurensis]MBB6443302.1 tetratricopeptide (TPR) repeat protein [Phycisphaera mikurensis]BAM03079.1 hypothetical protein PSMK_09200 [Phycisphaera mikurensis NBRC 102666]